MEIVVLPPARRHGIAPDEIRATIEYPQLTYVMESRLWPGVLVHTFIGRRDREAWIEVVAEPVGTAWMVFHAMLLTARTAAEVEDMSGGAIELDPVRTQRPPTTKGETR